MDKKHTIIAVVCTLIGLVGIADTIWFYSTATLPPGPSEYLIFKWPPHSMYVNLFVPGILVALGVLTRWRIARLLGLVFAYIWAAFAGSAIGQGLYALVSFTSTSPIPPGFGMQAVAFFSALFGFCIWEFAVLNGLRPELCVTAIA